MLMLLCFTHPARWKLLLQPLKGAEGGERRGPMGDSCQPRAANRKLCSVVSPRLWSSQQHLSHEYLKRCKWLPFTFSPTVSNLRQSG